MKYIIKIVLVLFPLILNLTSCKNPTEYSVDSAFTPYLNRFDSLAQLRGKNFDPQKTGLIIQFANLTNGNAGLTHYESPIRIEIDKTYWNDISNYAGAEMMKEDLIFHELGHGLLKRDHLNTNLENGDWKSMMCGGTKVNNRPWNINYRGIRRDYYINELFDQSTPAPAFSSKVLPIDTTGFSPAIYLSFNSVAEAGNFVKEDTNEKTSLDNGMLKFQSKVSETFLVYAKTSLDIQVDFSYELTLQYPTGDASNQYGLLFGYVPTGSDGINDPIEYFTINNNQKMYMGNRTWYSFYTELAENSIVYGGKNKLKVVKAGTMLYYFINNVYCYCSEMETTQSGYNYGFMVPSNGTVWVDNFTISRKKGSFVKGVDKIKPVVEFKMIKTNRKANATPNQ
jgi:hypothetical protein